MDDAARDLHEWLAAECDRLSIPGAVVGVVHEGRDLVACHGVTSTRDPLPVDADTLFLIGSTTKTLTATGLMSLVQAGRLSLDDRVVDHLVDLQLADTVAREAVTVGQLLDHTAGWVGDGETDTGWGDDALARAIPELVASREQLTPPGTVASYNNAAVVLAGHLLAVLCGESYEAAVRRLVLEPLGMAATWFLPWEVANRRLAVGHVLGADGPEPVAEWPIGRSIGPAGAAISTVGDQLRYLRFHLDGTAQTQPVGDELRRTMQQPRVAMGSMLDGVGVSWLLRRVRGEQVVEHGGNVSNLQISSFAMLPDRGAGVTTMANSVGGRELGARALDYVLETLLGVQRAAPPTLVAEDPGAATEYVGVYAAGQWDLVVEQSDGGLSVRMRLTDFGDEISDELRASFEQPTPVVLVAPDVVAPAADPSRSVGDFVRDESGAVRFLRYGLRLSARRD